MNKQNRHLLAIALAACAALTSAAAGAIAAPAPVYVHMNGDNDFLEPVVAVEPGQAVVFVSQDTGGVHTIVGYDPKTGATLPSINGVVAKTQGPGHPVSVYAVRLTKPGVYDYYCSVHADLAKTHGGVVQAAHKPGVDGFTGAMAGEIIVTNDPDLLRANPATSAEKIVPGFFGG
jgi:plastocyanin